MVTESNGGDTLVNLVILVCIFLILLPATYIYIRISRNIDDTKHRRNPIAYLRKHPGDISIMGILSGLPLVVFLILLEAPIQLLEVLVSLLVCSLIIALLTKYFRISYHLAAITILVIMATINWGLIFLISLMAIPLVTWAKYWLHEHTLPQLVAGIALSTAVVGITLYIIH
jgi:hypothetical protein